MTDRLATASAALGAALTDPAQLAGSERSAVLRCRSSRGGTVVVKTYPRTGEGAQGFTAEAAGLAFTAGLEVGPELLAADQAEHVVVMSDLGDAPSLADVLLGTSAERAEADLLSWVRACGELAVRTAGRQGDLAGLTVRYRTRETYDDAPHLQSGAGDGPARWLARRLSQIPRTLAELSLGVPTALAADLDRIAAALLTGDWEVFSPGDICPDNNLLTDSGVRFIDYESAEFHSAFLDAAYLRMPFSSCWCVFRLPEELAATAEAAYRDRVGTAYPELAADEVWQPGVRAAAVAWTLHAMTYLLDRSLIADGPMIDDGRSAPTARQLLRYRWQRLLTEPGLAAELPAITELMNSLLASTEHWQVPELPLYPAFR